MRSLTAAVAAALVLLPAAPAWAADGAPVVVDDAVTYRNNGGQDYLVNALANDSDPDGDTLTYTAVTPATKGNAYLQGGQLYYKPYLGNVGTDSFTYTVSDGQGHTADGTVTATLWVDPDAPGGLAISSSAPGSVTLAWTAAARATGYRVYRNGALMAGTSGLTWTDNGLSDTLAYEYRIAGVNGGDHEGRQSTTVYRRPQSPTPTAPLVSGTDDPATLSVAWSSGGWTGPWRVYRDGAPVASTMQPHWEDTGLATGQEYSYQVQLVGPSLPYSLAVPSLLSSGVRGTPGVLSDIWQLVAELGGTTGSLGPVTLPEHVVPGGRRQYHQNGVVLQQDGGPALAVMEPLATTWMRARSEHSVLGFPVTEQTSGLRDGGVAQFFEGGSIWDSPSTPAVIVYSLMEDGWAATGWEEGPLGYPTSGDVPTAAGGLIQMFENGAVYWTAASGAHGVSGSTGDVWSGAGAERGRLGYPTDDELCGLRNDGCFQEFEGGAIYSSQDNGVHTVFTPYLQVWAGHSWEDGRLGYPTSSEVCVAGRGCHQIFEGGTIHWSPAGGMHAVFTPYLHAWTSSGAETGRMGYPLTDEICVAGTGCHQQFQGGTIHWSPAGGMHAVFTPYLHAWSSSGAEAGRMGYPLTDEICVAGRGCHQQFQGGTIHWSPAGGMHAVFAPYLNAWSSNGRETGRLGYPLTDEICAAGRGCHQQFQGGTIHWSPTGGMHAVFTPYLHAWSNSGRESGRLGYPVSGEICGLARGGCHQRFQGGTLYWSAASGVQPVVGGIRDIWGAHGSEAGRLGYPTVPEFFFRGYYRQQFQGGTIMITERGPQVSYNL